jgi:hypothetical protein
LGSRDFRLFEDEERDDDELLLLVEALLLAASVERLLFVRELLELEDLLLD